MPEAISRSSISQLASYGPPEPVASEPPATRPAAASLPATLDLSAAHAPLERASGPSVSYEKCVAAPERAGGDTYKWNGAAAGCFAGALTALGKGPPQLMAAACAAAAVAGYMAGEGQGLTRGRNEGALACDDLPKKP